MTVHLNLPVVIPAELSVRPSQRDWDAPNVSAELLEQTRRDQRRTARTAVFPCHARRSVGHKVVSASESSLDGQEAGLCGSSGEMHVTPGSVGAMIG
jgi:hypothetical protein